MTSFKLTERSIIFIKISNIMKRLTKNLIENSIEAYILALETINRPSVKYRMEAFCFLFCNAWELVMKAKLLNDGEKILHRKKRKKPRTSLTFDECLDKIFTSDMNPIRLNLKKIHDFRCEAIHLVIPFVPPDIMGLFQAGVINYPKVLAEWFNISLSEKIPLGMMVLVYDFDPKKHSLESAKMARRLPIETINWLKEFQSEIRKQAVLLGETAQLYFIPINLKLVITKNPNKADIILSSGKVGKETIVLEVPKDIDKTHPYIRKELKEVINEKLAGSAFITPRDINCITAVFNLKDNTEFVYSQKHFSPKYSDAFADWIVRKIRENKNFLTNTRIRAYRLWHS